jgi:hypothetical protein
VGSLSGTGGGGISAARSEGQGVKVGLVRSFVVVVIADGNKSDDDELPRAMGGSTGGGVGSRTTGGVGV